MDTALKHLTSKSLKDEIDNDVKRFNTSLVGSRAGVDSLVHLVAFRSTTGTARFNWKCAAGAGIFAAGCGAALFLGCVACAVTGAGIALGACA